MSEERTQADLRAARNALKQWFISQDLSPADAGIVCSLFVAEQLVLKTRDVRELTDAINTFRAMLTLDVAGELR